MEFWKIFFINQTPLHLAVENIIPDSPKIVQMLLNDSNIDVNAYDNIFSLFFFSYNFKSKIFEYGIYWKLL